MMRTFEKMKQTEAMSEKENINETKERGSS
jgi:hypothetical protein